MINFVVACPGEARALINFYGLKRSSTQSLFPIYEGDEIRLIESGIGQIKAAAATAYLIGRYSEPKHEVWINIGIGGHPTLELGETRIAHKLFCSTNRATFYPVHVTPLPYPSTTVHTVDKPEENYPDNVIYEMEATAFYSIANRVSPAELVHCVKVVSDNRESHWKDLDHERVSKMIVQALPKLSSWFKSLKELSLELKNLEKEPRSYKNLLEIFHFTKTQEIELRDLLRQREVLSLPLIPTEKLRNSKEFLHVLRKDTLEGAMTR
ncbi:MAG: hypothetical protein CMO81_03665 [Waddliaceae bacterium]|nr:hypothetical protein [Waddliaceae bacterium]